MKWLPGCIGIFTLVALTGCGWFHHEDASAKPRAVAGNAATNAPDRMIITPDTASVGRVLRANENARYAVLNFPLGSVPPVDQRLDVYRHGLKVGEVKITGPQEQDNTVADIVAGDAQAGDEIR